MVDASSPDQIKIQVVFAMADRIWRKSFDLPAGSSVGQALAASGLYDEFPQLNHAEHSVGIYAIACGLDHILAENDRIEIYRPLHFDPKESRRRRALHKLAQKRAGKLAAGRMCKARRQAIQSRSGPG